MVRRLELLESVAGQQVVFRCTSCGNCCRDLRVAVTHRDLLRLMRVSGERCDDLVQWLAPEEVDMSGDAGPFVELDVGLRLLVLAQREGACRFLDPALRCGVYAARPQDCRVFPFDVQRSEEGARQVQLLNLTRCDYAEEGAESVERLEREMDERDRELAEYRELTARWNRLARHRRRLKHRARSGSEFFAFVGVGGMVDR